MKVDQVLWPIQRLVDLKDKINLNPAWQRGPAWKQSRRVLLIDSILREMDVPKIYLRKITGSMHTYEAVDGQQRLRAIWEFVDPNGGFSLKMTPDLSPVGSRIIADKTFAELDKPLRDRLLKFEIGVGEISSASNDEITVLFARLQMGMPLNPAELRNAELGRMRSMIQLMATSHQFFANTPMKDHRTKHFDYASYAFAVAANGVAQDMKSMDLRDLQRDYNKRPMEELATLSAKVGEALNVLAEVDQHTRYRITRKWIFVDLLGLIMTLQGEGRAIDASRFAAAYDAFEERRRAYISKPELLLNGDRADARPLDRSLYDYLFAFRTEGAKAASLERRQKTIARFFKNVEVR
jgi:hypothetical protein